MEQANLRLQNYNHELQLEILTLKNNKHDIAIHNVWCWHCWTPRVVEWRRVAPQPRRNGTARPTDAPELPQITFSFAASTTRLLWKFTAKLENTASKFKTPLW